MGLFGSLGGVIGGIKAKKYSKKAAAAQIAAAEKGIGEVNTQFGQTQGLYNPWINQGTGALGQYGNLVGTGGAEAQQAAIDQLQQSPFYQSLYRTGEEALLQNASATGGLRGGNTQRSLADFGADTLAQTIQMQLGNLSPLMELGMGGTNQLAGYGAQKASDISNLYLGQGQAKAADYSRRGALTQGIWQGIGTMGDQAASAAMGAGMGAGGMPFNFGSFIGNLGGYTAPKAGG